MLLCKRVAFYVSVEILDYFAFWPLQRSSPTLFFLYFELHVTRNVNVYNVFEGVISFHTNPLYHFCTLHSVTVYFSFFIKEF